MSDTTYDNTVDLDNVPDSKETKLFPKSVTTDVDLAPYDMNRHREEVREVLAKRLVLLLCGVVGTGAFAFLFMALRSLALDVNFDDNVQALMTFMNVLLTPVVGIVGTVVGFYYGTASAPGPGGNDHDSA
jgi:hypothetical protein